MMYLDDQERKVVLKNAQDSNPSVFEQFASALRRHVALEREYSLKYHADAQAKALEALNGPLDAFVYDYETSSSVATTHENIEKMKTYIRNSLAGENKLFEDTLATPQESARLTKLIENYSAAKSRVTAVVAEALQSREEAPKASILKQAQAIVNDFREEVSKQAAPVVVEVGAHGTTISRSGKGVS